MGSDVTNAIPKTGFLSDMIKFGCDTTTWNEKKLESILHSLRLVRMNGLSYHNQSATWKKKYLTLGFGSDLTFTSYQKIRRINKGFNFFFQAVFF